MVSSRENRRDEMQFARFGQETVMLVAHDGSTLHPKELPERGSGSWFRDSGTMEQFGK
jgi:hypothetical protein